MSHFNLAVITKEKPTERELDDKLLKFCESPEYVPHEFLEFSEDEDGSSEYNGKKGWWYNPNTKWDWFVVDGRWDKTIPLKTGEYVNQAKISDINFDVNKEKYQEAEKYWNEYVLGQNPDAYKSEFWKPEYYKNLYDSCEKYATEMSSFHSYAYLTDEGDWIEPGQMGWFGFSDETADSKDGYNEKFLDYVNAHQDCYLTVVDCHI